VEEKDKIVIEKKTIEQFSKEFLKFVENLLKLDILISTKCE
jgi:hypothetical protein